MYNWININNEVKINLDNVFSISIDGRNVNFTSNTGIIESYTFENQSQAIYFYDSLHNNVLTKPISQACVTN